MSSNDGLTGPFVEAEFTAIFEETYQKTLAYALRRVREPTDAHDVVADTYLVAWRRFDELREAEVAQAWLYAVAYGAISNQRRSERRRAELTKRAEGDIVAPSRRATDPAQIAEQRGEIAIVQAALTTLAERDREILRLAAFEELNHDEIGQVLGIRKALVRSLLYRARRRLDRALVEMETRRESGAGHKTGEDTLGGSSTRFPHD